MTKEEFLQYVKNAGTTRLVSREELLGAFEGDLSFEAHAASALFKRLSIAQILYYLGGAVVFIGIAVLVGQNWEQFSPIMRIFVTLGSGIAAYVVGALFLRDERLEGMGLGFFLVSALVLPIGIFVVLDQAGFQVADFGVQAFIAGIMAGIFLASRFLFQKIIFTVFAVLYSTWLYFALKHFLLGGATTFLGTKDPLYDVVLIGLAYMFLGYAFSRTSEAPLTGFLYAAGSFGFLGGTLALGAEEGTLWDLVYPLFVFGIIFLSVHVKSRAFLTFGTVFLMAYILKITGQYFSEGLGWPLALVLAGFALMGVGYFAVRMNKRYFSATL